MVREFDSSRAKRAKIPNQNLLDLNGLGLGLYLKDSPQTKVTYKGYV